MHRERRRRRRQCHLVLSVSDRSRAKAWFESLSPFDRGELGDALVLGTFDWREMAIDEAHEHVFGGGRSRAHRMGNAGLIVSSCAMRPQAGSLANK
jgi:hypothetical protein